jgi:hypothetical protein
MAWSEFGTWIVQILILAVVLFVLAAGVSVVVKKWKE